MKKIKKLFSDNIKPVVAFIIWVIISGWVVYAATTIASSQVSYTPPTGSGITSTDVQQVLSDISCRVTAGYAKCNVSISSTPSAQMAE